MEQCAEVKYPDSQLELPTLDPTYFDEFGNIRFSPVDAQTFSEETLDVSLKYATMDYKPYSPRGPPSRNSLPGPINFCVEVNSTDVHKKKFLYSHKLGRIYVDINCDFSVSFNWDPSYTQADMYVRATVVFSETEQSEKRVERCVQHFHESSGIPKEIAKNVLHSSREIGTQGVFYCGDADILDSWYSVLVHFNKSTHDPCTHAYKFTCKSSCASGINRRAIAIIFTLEDSMGRVCGRQIVGVKVCSCLRRDMLKDEEAEGVYKSGKKRIPSNQIPQTKTKKIKLETRDNVPDMVMLPQIMVESNAMVSGLRTMVDMMTNGGLHDPEMVEKYSKSIADLKKIIANLETSTPPAPVTQ